MYRKTIDGLKVSLDQDLKNRVVEHRNRFIEMIIGRYNELLPYLIVYENIETTAINQLRLEIALRNNRNIVVGETSNGYIQILGYINKFDSWDYSSDFLYRDRLTHKDIEFTIPKQYIKPKMNEIQTIDDCKTGDFIVLRNKALNYVNDKTVIQHYAVELGEIVASRFSIAMQSKINTFFMGNNGDETINQLVSDLYNGSPAVKVSPAFDPRDNIFTLDNTNLSNNFMELKREYQNKISELNNMLGINSLAVEKESGVSDVEAKSNQAYTTSNSNIYLSTRQNELDKLNKRYNLNLKVMYNDNVRSELSNLSEIGSDLYD